MSKKIFAANWKLNKTPEEARQFLIQFKNEAFKRENFFQKNEIMIFPSAFSIEAVSSLCAKSAIGFGPQNIYSEKSGAFTGENSAEVAKQLNCGIALVGHSERREIFKEADELLNKKMLLLQQLQIQAVFCIGETLAQREAGQTLEVCFSQIDKGLNGTDKNARLIVAYEPVWAIGTGKVATPEQVAEVHLKLHGYLSAKGFTDIQLLYGGSVKPENSKQLLSIPHVDGFLIGGASLQVDSFLKICQ
ncbi:MAG: triose-phosphate isomerase [Pseudobdellovibrio sp.]